MVTRQNLQNVSRRICYYLYMYVKGADKMSKKEVIMALAEYFGVDMPKDINRDYAWNSGCSMSGSDNWLTLANVVEALDSAYLLDDEDDYCD